ncbi:MAG: GNAT family N-acetyltransferase [bacterium]
MTSVRRFHPDDALATRDIFVAAVHQGAAGRYTAAELADWVPDPAMPDGWGSWLNDHITFVAEDHGLLGFMMLERSGYLNMAFVLPEQMGKGVADALYAATMVEARALNLPRLHVLASRYAQSFFTRHGWLLDPTITGLEGMDPNQGPDDNPVNRPMSLRLAAK